MQQKPPFGATLISAGIHALVLFILVGGFAFLSGPHSGGGGGMGGDVVTVWLAGPTGPVVGDPATAPPKSIRSLVHQSAPTSKSSAAVATIGRARGNGDGLGGGTQSGVGSGDGAGIGSGDGGQATLTQIWKRINRSKYYPAAARRRGIEGSPKVTFEIDPDGRVTNATIATSCGNVQLDKAALETVRRAAPLPYYPQPITLAVRYSLSK